MSKENIYHIFSATITDKDSKQLPLTHFDFLVLVEPNQGAQEASAAQSSIGESSWKCILDTLDNEFGWNTECEADENNNSQIQPNQKVTISPKTRIVWVKNEMEDANFFENCITVSMSDAIFPYKLGSTDFPEFLILFARDLKYRFSDMKVAVIGGIFENEVSKVANLFQESGLETTILSRYCFSENGLATLDKFSNKF